MAAGAASYGIVAGVSQRKINAQCITKADDAGLGKFD